MIQGEEEIAFQKFITSKYGRDGWKGVENIVNGKL
jgi:hypothetical protein